MNKVYTIGRDETCDIIIRDSSDVVSRVHATLRSNGNGKYTLVDQSRNGTYVNGIRMSTNEEIPVTRKDVVSFAHVQDLDWEQIPKEKKGKKTVIILIISFVAITAIAYGVIRYLDHNGKGCDNAPIETLPTDSIKIKADTIKVKDTIYVKPKAIPEKKENNKGNDTKDENEKPQQKDEEEVINPLI
jgi:pSer/pThr/pTyr-binding forkhead associated (FHA) protein